MLSRRLKTSLAISVGILLVLLGSLLIADHINQLGSEHVASQLQNEQTSAELVVYVYEYSRYWTRDPIADLPRCDSTLRYSITNVGNGIALNMQITVEVDGEDYDQDFVTSLSTNQKYSNSLSVTINYDSTRHVSVEASCNDSSDSTSLSLSANLPRNYDSNLCKLFITPSEGSLIALKNKILREKFPLTPDWIALRDWVGNNIEYRYDSEIYTRDYWQLPKETAKLRKGDCEDFAILLCSLLRANGWSSNDVYIVLGKKGNNYHAWVKIDFGLLGWYNIEPQANGWNTILGDILRLDGYQAEFNFNDSQFHVVG